MVETFRKIDGFLFKLKQCHSRRYDAKSMAESHRERERGNKARVVPFGRAYCVYIHPVIIHGKLITDIVK